MEVTKDEEQGGAVDGVARYWQRARETAADDHQHDEAGNARGNAQAVTGEIRSLFSRAVGRGRLLALAGPIRRPLM